MGRSRGSWVKFAIIGVALFLPVTLFSIVAAMGWRSVTDALSNWPGAIAIEGSAIAGWFFVFHAWSLRGRRAAPTKP